MTINTLMIAAWLLLAAIIINGLLLPQKLSLLKKLRVKQAHRALSIANSIESPGRRFSYLRKVNFYVFEEMINISLKTRSLAVKRTVTYSRDGGIDGTFFIGYQKFLIQAKRYRSHIKPTHVSDFSRLCLENNCYGLFIHTGKTGPKSREMRGDNVAFISGTNLLKLLNQEEVQFTFHGVSFKL